MFAEEEFSSLSFNTVDILSKILPDDTFESIERTSVYLKDVKERLLHDISSIAYTQIDAYGHLSQEVSSIVSLEGKLKTLMIGLESSKNRIISKYDSMLGEENIEQPTIPDIFMKDDGLSRSLSTDRALIKEFACSFEDLTNVIVYIMSDIIVFVIIDSYTNTETVYKSFPPDKLMILEDTSEKLIIRADESILTIRPHEDKNVVKIKEILLKTQNDFIIKKKEKDYTQKSENKDKILNHKTNIVEMSLTGDYENSISAFKGMKQLANIYENNKIEKIQFRDIIESSRKHILWFLLWESNRLGISDTKRTKTGHLLNDVTIRGLELFLIERKNMFLTLKKPIVYIESEFIISIFKEFLSFIQWTVKNTEEMFGKRESVSDLCKWVYHISSFSSCFFAGYVTLIKAPLEHCCLLYKKIREIYVEKDLGYPVDNRRIEETVEKEVDEVSKRYYLLLDQTLKYIKTDFTTAINTDSINAALINTDTNDGRNDNKGTIHKADGIKATSITDDINTDGLIPYPYDKSSANKEREKILNDLINSLSPLIDCGMSKMLCSRVILGISSCTDFMEQHLTERYDRIIETFLFFIYETYDFCNITIPNIENIVLNKTGIKFRLFRTIRRKTWRIMKQIIDRFGSLFLEMNFPIDLGYDKELIFSDEQDMSNWVLLFLRELKDISKNNEDINSLIIKIYSAIINELTKQLENIVCKNNYKFTHNGLSQMILDIHCILLIADSSVTDESNETINLVLSKSIKGFVLSQSEVPRFKTVEWFDTRARAIIEHLS
eukprot:GHVP01041995.1.p1 GENE.GHVP01041995.1~~GHVP01041995.1.p1  ORF type:complete len:780 (-),score=130.07 GHVP01041995.1:152-2491(-)